jgi:hypothetical protein
MRQKHTIYGKYGASYGNVWKNVLMRLAPGTLVIYKRRNYPIILEVSYKVSHTKKSNMRHQ